MTISINQKLISRLNAVRAAFSDPKLASYVSRYETSDPATKPAAAKHWRDALKDEDSGDSGGGGGTIKGLRGKDAEYAKQAMRKLTRSSR